MVVASVLGGVVFGIGASADAWRTLDDPDRMSEAEKDARMEDRLQDQFTTPTALLQLAVLSCVAAMLGGAVTGLMVEARPGLNGLAVGIVSLAGALFPAGPIPRRVLVLAGIATVPFAVFGALVFA